MTVVARSNCKETLNQGRLIGEWDILTQPDHKRVALAVAVDHLHEIIPSLATGQVQGEHLHTY